VGELGVRAVRAACRACFGMMGEGFAKCRGRQGGHICSTLPRRVVLAGLEKVIKPWPTTCADRGVRRCKSLLLFRAYAAGRGMHRKPLK
jgi:hypothetical protein